MKLYIVRHGETDWNVKRRLQGRTDIPLNENGREAARKTAAGIKETAFDLAISSPLKRATETAQILLEGRNVPILQDERLIEMSFGVLEGHKPNAVSNLFFQHPDRYQPPEGAESIEHLIERTGEFLRDLASRWEYREKSILIATHGAATRAILANVKQIPVKEFWEGSVPKNCGITLLECKENGKYQVLWQDRVFF